MKKLLTITIAGVLCSSALASSYFVVVPFKGKATTTTPAAQPLPVSINLATVTPPLAGTGLAYSFSLKPFVSSSAPGFNADAVSWVLTGGALPPGLTLDSQAGLVSGTPTTEGEASATFKASYKGADAATAYAFKVIKTPGFQLKMDGANGDTAFLDSGPMGYALVSENGAALSMEASISGGSSGKFNKALNQRAVLNNVNALDLGPAFTVEGWVRLSVVQSYAAHLFGKGNGVDPGTWSFITLNKKFCFTLTTLCSSTLAVPDTWYHLAVSRLNGTMRLFVNGNQEAIVTGNTSNFQSTALFTLGDRIQGDAYGQYPMTGFLDNIRVYPTEARYTSAQSFTPEVELP